jgi:hypothetical protein
VTSVGLGGDRGELLGGVSRRPNSSTPERLVRLEAGDPDHEEFVEVVAEIDRKRSRSSSGWAGCRLPRARGG